jgi:hypothetical protein
MKHSILVASAAISVFLAGAPVLAHHSFASYDVSQQKLVEGTVTQWNYNNPHSWLMIDALDANGEMKTWSFEGAAIVHAARQGVNGTTYKKGEKIRVVMHPMRDGRNAGALCFVIKEDGTFTRPNDGICDSEAMHERWEQKGWLARDAKSLTVHPASD